MTEAFGVRLGPGDKPAVLVVDALAAYLEPRSPLYAGQGAAEAVRAASEVVAAARVARLPVVFTAVRYAPGMADGGLWWRKIPGLRVLEEGNPLGDFSSDLAPRQGELVIRKQYASAFFGTSLDATLRTMGVDTVVLTGLSTSGCVRASVVDAISLGFRPMVVREAVGDRDHGPHASALFDIEAKYGDVISLVDALALLTGLRR